MEWETAGSGGERVRRGSGLGVDGEAVYGGGGREGSCVACRATSGQRDDLCNRYRLSFPPLTPGASLPFLPPPCPALPRIPPLTVPTPCPPLLGTDLLKVCLAAVVARPEYLRSEIHFIKSLIRAEANTGPVALACSGEAAVMAVRVARSEGCLASCVGGWVVERWRRRVVERWWG
ncbi:hypothetical protein E2C01_025868 [Portunus trituberculatus]|uniref:Uncharacterized protein n=1 Tax=Portunus trituberculatus TaxID=210409 RepID=A0A5B7EJ41_PORTR|nr:hypothetical protein [Portunus trituberculatus]